MFNAALEILYAGVGNWNLGAMAMEPKVDVLNAYQHSERSFEYDARISRCQRPAKQCPS
jgi:hypothetical protein